MKNRKLLKNLICAVFVLFVGFAVMSPVIATADTKSEYAQAQAELDKINKEVNSLKSETKKKETAKKNVTQQINLVKNQIAILNGEIAQTNENLVAKQTELENKKTEIYQTDELFKERLRAMYMMRNSGTLSTVLGANSVSEMLTAADTLQRISVSDTDLLKYLDEQKQVIEAEEAEIERTLAELEEQQKNLEKKQTELAGYLRVANEELTEAQARQQAAERTQSGVYAIYTRAKAAYEREIREAIAQGGTVEAVGGDYIWPVPTNGSISSPFGPRTLYGKYDYHTGIDINTGSGPYIHGKAIVAAKSGTVIRAIYGSTGYGYYIMLNHGGGYYSIYGHCSALYVGLGDTVIQGQTIAAVGSTGNSTGPHLHYEMRYNNQAFDPLPYVAGTRPAIR